MMSVEDRAQKLQVILKHCVEKLQVILKYSVEKLHATAENSRKYWLFRHSKRG